MDTKIVNKLSKEILLVSTKAIVFYRVCTNLKMEIIKIFDFPTIARRLLKLYTSNLVKVTAWKSTSLSSEESKSINIILSSEITQFFKIENQLYNETTWF